jgi:hypothetical protein
MKQGMVVVGLVAVAGLLSACLVLSSNERDGSVSDAASGDGGAGECNCPADQPVTMFHSCTPPLEIGCVAEICEPGVTDCGEGYTCEECSAAACCHCAACMPTCVFTGPAQGPLPEYLKLHTTYGSAGQEQEIVVEGFPFYIGALFYLARVGDSDDLVEASYPSTCAHGFTAPAHAAGIEPVWVSQYGGNEPWVLAGFFTYTTGEYPSCVQPGYPCTEPDSCCETDDVPMTCADDGRCRMQ